MLRFFGLIVMTEARYDKLIDLLCDAQKNDQRDPKTGRFVKKQVRT